MEFNPDPVINPEPGYIWPPGSRFVCQTSHPEESAEGWQIQVSLRIFSEIYNPEIHITRSSVGISDQILAFSFIIIMYCSRLCVSPGLVFELPVMSFSRLSRLCLSPGYQIFSRLCLPPGSPGYVFLPALPVMPFSRLSRLMKSPGNMPVAPGYVLLPALPVMSSSRLSRLCLPPDSPGSAGSPG